jgi:hypothetical protein
MSSTTSHSRLTSLTEPNDRSRTGFRSTNSVSGRAHSHWPETTATGTFMYIALATAWRA